VIHENILKYRAARYLWWSLALGAGGIVLFLSQDATEPRNGGTWQGYVLGTVGALLIVWLSVLGLRKRSYRGRLGGVQGWTSAHVYFGTMLLLVVTLHCAGQFGWNIHTLAYALMCLVIVSGGFGMYTYLVYPRRLSDIRSGGSREALFGELFELDKRGRELARQCEPEVQSAVLSGIARTALGGGVLAQLFARDRSRFIGNAAETSDELRAAASSMPNLDQQAVIDIVAARVPRANKRTEVATLQALLSLLSRRQAILRRLRNDVALQGWLRVWLYVHVPITFGLLAALTAHIVSTFVYW
jgi:hypothetical protein